jgi:hypothetical protein
MSSDLQDFDLRCQGAYRLAEEWQASPQLKVVWLLEDILEVYNELLPRVIETYEEYCETGRLPERLSLSIVLEQLRGLAHHGGNLLRIVGEAPAGGFDVNGVATLRRHVEVAKEILRDEDYATDMSFLNFSES